MKRRKGINKKGFEKKIPRIKKGILLAAAWAVAVSTTLRNWALLGGAKVVICKQITSEETLWIEIGGLACRELTIFLASKLLSLS